MITAAPARPVHSLSLPRPRFDEFTGVARTSRLILRRDRVILPLWVTTFAILLPITYAGSIRAVYRTDADLASFALATNANHAEVALYGPVYLATLGAVTIWKAQILNAILAVAVVLTVIRHTRTEEEAGRSELLGAGTIGRYAGLTSAVLVASAASVLSGLGFTVLLRGYDLPAAGSVAFGLGLASTGILFAAVAAVCAQLSASARTARGLALGVVGAAFAVRAVGDLGSGTLSWFSPLGWPILMRPYAGERWWVPILPLAATVAVLAVAAALAAHRDLGGGMIAERAGAARAGRTVSGPFGLAWHLHRVALMAWIVGLALYGVLFGSSVTSVSGQMGSNEGFQKYIERLGGAAALDDTVVGLALGILAMMISGYAVSAVLRLHTEETEQRAEAVLAGSIGRIRWAATHLLFAFGGPAVAMLAAGLTAGLTYGAAVHDFHRTVPACLAGAAVQLPAVWFTAAVTVALVGAAPRIASAAWAVYTGFLLVYILGATTWFPRWARDLEPFGRLPKLPGGHFTATAVAWELGLAAVLTGAGLVAFRRRDLG
ncbi:ABC transporter permease [Nocardia stercoris]|uniref:ABC transporter permease n=1 Tax=Nocardia stercoris TaxID=2483361 RepID=A0A3M2L7G7_9NOCA|nr:ABC transporter permease [Nocardia stercoris]RMI33569.1 ABC transporter permease [Nocardia stercoris]